MTVALVETDDVPTERHWLPDHQLVVAVLAGAGNSRTMRQLCPEDRAWVVAGLTAAGLTADAVAGLLHCSLRSVRAVKAEPLYAVCKMMAAEATNFTDELRLVRDGHRRLAAELAAALQESARVRAQLARLIAARAGQFSCGHSRDKVNTYRQPRTGKEWCRKCHADRQRDYRRGRAEQPSPAAETALAACMTGSVTRVITSGSTNTDTSQGCVGSADLGDL